MLFAQRPREAVKEVHGFSGDLPRRKSKKDNAPIQVRGQAEESKAINRRYARYKRFAGYADEELFMGVVETNDYPSVIVS
jgi:hypothetical protein